MAPSCPSNTTASPGSPAGPSPANSSGEPARSPHLRSSGPSSTWGRRRLHAQDPLQPLSTSSACLYPRLHSGAHNPALACGRPWITSAFQTGQLSSACHSLPVTLVWGNCPEPHPRGPHPGLVLYSHAAVQAAQLRPHQAHPTYSKHRLSSAPSPTGACLCCPTHSSPGGCPPPSVWVLPPLTLTAACMVPNTLHHGLTTHLSPTMSSHRAEAGSVLLTDFSTPNAFNSPRRCSITNCQTTISSRDVSYF